MTASPERYRGGRRGTGRDLSPHEHRQWTQAAARWHASPPASPQQAADNDAVRHTLVTLFEDGVSLPVLAHAAGWGQPRIAGILHRARQGQHPALTGTRRLIPAQASAHEPHRRPLRARERTDLRSLYERLPRHRNGARGWRGHQGRDLLERMDALALDLVAMEDLGQALGMTRQAVHQHLLSHRQRASALAVVASACQPAATPVRA